MKNYLVILSIILLCNIANNSQSQEIQLSNFSHISLITCGPGDQLYSAFGHSALRVYDPVNKIDKVYNYGTFDFDAPNFYLNFVQGNLNYMLTVASYKRFEYGYIHENRSIYEQILNLTASEKQKVYNFLEWNALPENKFYLYDFLLDNCATRIRDVLMQSLGDSLKFKDFEKETSFWQEINPYLGDNTWMNFGIRLIHGLKSYKTVDKYEITFLPDFLMQAFSTATITRNLTTEPLVKQTNTIFKAPPAQAASFTIFRPVFVLIFLLIIYLLITYFEYRKQRIFYGFDVLLFGVTGLLGTVLFLVWVATNHNVPTNNLNIIWAIPLHLIVAILLLRKKKPAFLQYYFLITGIIQILLLLCWNWIPQELHLALIPLIIALAIRSFNLHINLKKSVL